MKETKFKQTEVGMIPSDWEVKTLGELYKVHNGLSKGKQFFGHGYPFLSFSVVFNNVFIPNKLENLVDSSKEERASYSINKGDVFITRTSETVDELGMSCVALKDYPNATYNGFCKRLRPNDVEFVNLGYLGFYLRSDFIREWFLKFSTVTTRASLKNDELLSLPLVLPPTIEEQQRIANALSDVDTLIANLEKLIAKKKNIKQGAMQQLLTGKKRLPGFGKPWIDKKLGEGLKFQCGAPFQSTYFNREHQGVRLIKNRDLKSDDQIYYYDGEYTYDYIVKNGNLLVGMDGDFMPCLWNKGTALLNQRVGRILTNCWSLPYLYYILIKPLLEKQDGTGATTVKHLSHRDVENMVVYMTTDIQEQTAIANVLSDMDTEISALETKLAKYRTLKTGMMQQLLTGKIRLI